MTAASCSRVFGANDKVNFGLIATAGHWRGGTSLESWLPVKAGQRFRAVGFARWNDPRSRNPFD